MCTPDTRDIVLSDRFDASGARAGEIGAVGTSMRLIIVTEECTCDTSTKSPFCRRGSGKGQVAAIALFKIGGVIRGDQVWEEEVTNLTDNACCESRGVDQSSGRRARQFSACLEESPRSVCCQNRLASLNWSAGMWIVHSSIGVPVSKINSRMGH